MKLQLTSRNLEEKTNYIKPVKEFSLGDWEYKRDFFINQIQGEVISLSKTKKKQFKRICQSTIATFASTFLLVTPSFAQSPTAIEVTTTNALDGFMPKDLVIYGLILMTIIATASTILAIILMQLAGGLKMLRKSKDANEWMTDIMKGYTIVIVSPILILTIAIVAYLLFGNFKWFAKPF